MWASPNLRRLDCRASTRDCGKRARNPWRFAFLPDADSRAARPGRIRSRLNGPLRTVSVCAGVALREGAFWTWRSIQPSPQPHGVGATAASAGGVRRTAVARARFEEDRLADVQLSPAPDQSPMPAFGSRLLSSTATDAVVALGVRSRVSSRSIRRTARSCHSHRRQRRIGNPSSVRPALGRSGGGHRSAGAFAGRRRRLVARHGPIGATTYVSSPVTLRLAGSLTTEYSDSQRRRRNPEGGQ